MNISASEISNTDPSIYLIALKEKKRLTLNIPYDTVIIEKNGKKTYLAPENRDMMLETIKGINPEITFSSSQQ